MDIHVSLDLLTCLLGYGDLVRERKRHVVFYRGEADEEVGVD